jgi:hypothetical protein
MWARNLLFLSLCTAGLWALGASLSPDYKALPNRQLQSEIQVDRDFQHTVRRVNEVFAEQWTSLGLEPADRADDLTLVRRLSLALTGFPPSIEDLRRWESEPVGPGVDSWLAALLQDQRHYDYLAERLARATVGTENGPFIVYRRGRYVAWLADQLKAQRGYNEIITDLLTSQGYGTDTPATNFLNFTIKNEQGNKISEKELAARVARAFLGVRLDCAECHDHPFEPWKQADFQGLAAFFGQTRFQGIRGIKDEPSVSKVQYEVENRVTGKLETIMPTVPFHAELLPAASSKLLRRQRLAQWVTDPANDSFAREAVNRMWSLMFGRALIEPVDDIRSSQTLPPALDILADDFVRHDYDLRRLIRLIAATDAFRLDSRAVGRELSTAHGETWAAFPITRLRPEQVVNGVLQSASLETLNYDSHILIRMARQIGQNDFVKSYGDAGEEELLPQGGTIPQRLLMMNGNVVKNKTDYNMLLNASTQIALLAPNDAKAIEVAYLAVLTRRPTDEEAAYFTQRLAEDKTRNRYQKVEDLYWTLINSTEFSWNH